LEAALVDAGGLPKETQEDKLHFGINYELMNDLLSQ